MVSWLKNGSRFRFHSISSEGINGQIITAQQSAKKIYKFLPIVDVEIACLEAVFASTLSDKRKRGVRRGKIALNVVSRPFRIFSLLFFVIVIKILSRAEMCYI